MFKHLWTPAQLSSSILTGWYDAADTATITHSSNDVSQWDDKSGNDRHVLQPTGSEQPLTNTNTVNGLNVINFVHADDHTLQTSATCTWLNSTAFHIFALLKPSNAVDKRYFVGTNQGVNNKGLHVGYDDANSWAIDFYNDRNNTMQTVRGTDPLMVMISYLDPGSHTFENGTEASGSDPANPANDLACDSGKFNIGCGFQITTFTWDGDIGELFVIKGSITTALRQKAEGYFANKWKLQSLLPAAHPYKQVWPTA
jgi:hypothetical protein